MLSTHRLLRIDRWLKGLDRLIHRIPSQVSKNTQRRGIVVIKLKGLGSIVRFLSHCKKNQVDLSALRLITFSVNRMACEWMGLNGAQYIRTDTVRHFASDCWAIRRAIANDQPEWIINLERGSHTVSIFSQWLAWACKSRIVSFGVFPRLSESHRCYETTAYPFYRMMDVATELLPKRQVFHSIPLSRIREHSKVIVNINAGDYLLARRYPASLFEDVILKLCEAWPKARFIFTGILSESAYVDQIASRLTHAGVDAHSVAGTWTLPQFADELTTARLFITNDSGPLAISIHLGTPTVAIWGPTQPDQFGYVNNPCLLNITRSLACSPCLVHPHSPVMAECQGKVNCLTELAPAFIAKQILEWEIHHSALQPISVA